MDLYTTVLRKSGPYWVALYLEKGIVGQGYTKEAAIEKLKEAIDSIAEAQRIDSAIYSAALLIEELHEFLTVEGVETISGPLEMRALYA
jgi:predicted RNase H-like HicB family nuclease